MAKESMKAREVKRAKMVARYAEKRAALKKIIATSEDPAEAYEAGSQGSRAFPRMRILSVCTTVARLQVVPKDICVSSVCHVSSSVRWLPTV